MTHDAPTVTIGGPGGALYADACPDDQVLIGVHATSTPDAISSIAALCGRISIVPPASGAAGPAKLEVHEAVVLPKRGAGDSNPLVSRCPPGEVVTGFDTIFDVREDAYEMRRLRLFCAPLSVVRAGALPGAEVGVQHGLEPLLDWAEKPVIAGPIPCLTGSLGRGLLVRAGLWVDAFALLCAVPEIARADGAECTRAVECTSSVCPACGEDCDRVCQPYTCPERDGCTCSVWDGKHYLFCSEGLPYAQAGQACGEVGGHLVYVDSQTENGWARATASAAAMAGEFWLGADDRELEGTFRWGNGAIVDDRLGFWPSQSLPGDDRDCLQLNSDGRWLEARCEDARPYVCELEPAAP
jgi:hypothetical protein